MKAHLKNPFVDCQQILMSLLSLAFVLSYATTCGQEVTPKVARQSIAAITNMQVSSIGRGTSVSTHLDDGQEFAVSLGGLFVHGKRVFNANWTDQEGGGRPLTKGTGRPLSDPSHPLIGARSFNRISSPDANSCAGCHNAPYGISGGGDFVTNVFVLGQRFDFVTFDPSDKTPHPRLGRRRGARHLHRNDGKPTQPPPASSGRAIWKCWRARSRTISSASA